MISTCIIYVDSGPVRSNPRIKLVFAASLLNMQLKSCFSELVLYNDTVKQKADILLLLFQVRNRIR